MPKYRVTQSGHYYRNAEGDLVEAKVGDEIELSEREARGLEDRLEEVLAPPVSDFADMGGSPTAPTGGEEGEVVTGVKDTDIFIADAPVTAEQVEVMPEAEANAQPASGRGSRKGR